jgi:hypothetical protein
MRILITLHDLDQYGGVQSWVWTMAQALGQDDEVDVFTHVGGCMSKEIQRLGVGYLHEKTLPPDDYDLILVNHNTTAQLFTDYEAVTIYTQHGPTHDVEQYQGNCDGVVGVSEEVCAVLKGRGHTPTCILNPIDLNRFFPFGPPGDGVVNMCKSLKAQQIIEKACERGGIPFTSLHYKSGCFEVENVMRQHQIVVGYGRCIYEGLALGLDAFVFGTRLPKEEVVADGWVTKDNIDDWAKKNCSGRTQRISYGPEALAMEMIFKPKPDPNSWQRRWAEQHVDSEQQALKYLDLYETLLTPQQKALDYA